uniref:Tumor protein p53-inducible protein 11 n=1 Tax=Balaenoptera musculus TaxID=9771 RepID=A0A8C0DGN6_BALMU
MAAKQPPPLMKKHSQTDLVSRLKTRKILGVGGEDDDGEVHRSKISQVLGNEMKFAVREPLGLRVWQFVSAVLFSGIAIMALTFPDQLYDAVFDGAQVTSKTPIRLYGGALLSISLIMWNALYTAEKVIIRWTLLTEACYFSVQFLDEGQDGRRELRQEDGQDEQEELQREGGRLVSPKGGWEGDR